MGSFYVYTSVFIAQLSMLFAATTITWSSPMMPKFEGTEDNPLGRKITPLENSWLVSLTTLGSLIGAIICGALTSIFGRKTLLLVGGLLFLIVALVMAWAKNIWFFFACRLLIGVGAGFVLAVLPIYSAEVAQVKNRGILGASMAVFMNIGLLIPYCVGPYLPFFWFHILLACPPAIFLSLFLFYAPESPYFLMRTNPKKARKVLEKIRDKTEVDKFLEEIKRDLENDHKGSFLDIFRNKGSRKAFFIAFGLYTFMQLSGTAIIATYAQTIFEDAGSDISPEVCPIIIGVAQLITTMIVAPFADRFPRKLLLITSHLGVAIMEIPLGIYFMLKDSGKDVSNISIIPLISLILYVILFNCGVGPMVLTILGELFPLAVKGKAVSLLSVYSASSIFLLILLFNRLIEEFGIGQIFLFFSFCGFLAAIFNKIVMIETRGKTFEEIQEKLNR